MDCKIIGGFLCLLAFAPYLSAEPFNTRDQDPLAMIQGLPLPANAILPRAGNISWSTTFNVTNTLNLAHTSSESILLDYESHELIPSLSYGLSNRWALKLDIPVIYYGPGFLDKRIDRWHQLLNLPQGNRPDFPDNQFHLSYVSGANTVFNIDQASTSLGDSQLSLGKQLVNSTGQALSLWFTADLPTGNPNRLTGSRKTNWIIQLAGQHRLNSNWRTDANLALTFPGETSLNTVAIAGHIWSAQTGIEWRAFKAVSLRVQLDGHTAIYPDSGLKLLGSNYQLVFGGRVHLDRCSNIDVDSSEDIKVDASPDVSFGFRYQHLTGCR